MGAENEKGLFPATPYLDHRLRLGGFGQGSHAPLVIGVGIIDGSGVSPSGRFFEAERVLGRMNDWVIVDHEHLEHGQPFVSDDYRIRPTPRLNLAIGEQARQHSNGFGFGVGFLIDENLFDIFIFHICPFWALGSFV